MESTFKNDIDKIMEWIHSGPSLHLITAFGIPIHAHVSLLFLTCLIVITGISNISYTLITLSIGWMTSLLTSLNHYQVTKAVGGVIEKDVLWAPGGISPASYKGIPDSLKLMAACAGPLLLFPFFIVYFLLSGGTHVEWALGLIAPGVGMASNSMGVPGVGLTTFEAVMYWAASLMLWLMAINFCYPLHPLTGFEILRYTIGRFVSRQILVSVALMIALPMTAVFFWQGATYFNLLQIWIGIWGLPQVIQLIFAIATDSVDKLPFFAGEEVSEEVVPATYGKMEEPKWDTKAPSSPAQAQPSLGAKIAQLRVSTGMKLPPSTYTIEDAVA